MASMIDSLTNTLLVTSLSEVEARERLLTVHRDVLQRSRFIRDANFGTIHSSDLDLLLSAYDDRFFERSIRQALHGSSLRFRLSTRMTKAGGKTTAFRSAGDVHYEIAISCGLLFDAFGASDRQITVCGVKCGTRLDALQRIFEHELVHLLENICWGGSNCAAPRFQDIARRYFLHRSHRHQLITRPERAATVGIRPGSEVTFVFDGRQLRGRVNRITSRVSVLVEDSAGRLFSDGRRYHTYYVPLQLLTPVSLV